ncbi:hypothetical protein BN7_2256 [Wickerhamomyces ciferrii]|uniref:Uncharacterized protein n=1 Tax=Wickerhamomyces ciferrii (strain ATCC 14091 / BCRC 22168 / CBS 111 / JCM 3599 / NBRC 0793 / NRRL Y-1031 F-60-10) TaxID=1206466 RepID=K0KKN1_WICCF|nr:uncharacterized protein BN7_2256 [Wickerhamomyces ciferrii]CCH42712.1 hypothetical protein BN7_2256 [Wickerhamomyces ciferrii]
MYNHRFQPNLNTINDENAPFPHNEFATPPKSQHSPIKRQFRTPPKPPTLTPQHTGLSSNSPLKTYSLKSRAASIKSSLPPPPAIQPATVALIGDSNCGKTSLIHTYLYKTLKTPSKSILFETYKKIIKFNNNTSVELSIWDFPGDEYFDRFRPLAYANAKGILVCFTLERMDSLKNVEERWLPELKTHCPNAVKIMVGLGSEVRYDKTKNSTIPSFDQLYKISKKLGCKYMECSLIDQESYSNIFKQLAMLCVGVEDDPIETNGVSPIHSNLNNLSIPKTRSSNTRSNTRANTMSNILYLDDIQPPPEKEEAPQPKQRVTSYRKRRSMIGCSIV